MKMTRKNEVDRCSGAGMRQSLFAQKQRDTILLCKNFPIVLKEIRQSPISGSSRPNPERVKCTPEVKAQKARIMEFSTPAEPADQPEQPERSEESVLSLNLQERQAAYDAIVQYSSEGDYLGGKYLRALPVDGLPQDYDSVWASAQYYDQYEQRTLKPLDRPLAQIGAVRTIVTGGEGETGPVQYVEELRVVCFTPTAGEGEGAPAIEIGSSRYDMMQPWTAPVNDPELTRQAPPWPRSELEAILEVVKREIPPRA
jgi:hypothetical protein